MKRLKMAYERKYYGSDLREDKFVLEEAYLRAWGFIFKKLSVLSYSIFYEI